MIEIRMHRLRRYRRLNNITLAALADRVGCSGVHLRDIEQGRISPRVELVKRLIDETGLAWEDFLPAPAEAVE